SSAPLYALEDRRAKTTVALVFVTLLASAATLNGQCGVNSTLFVGGQVAPAFRSFEGGFDIPVFYLDRAHPATADIAATRADFSTADVNSIFSIQFFVVRPTGDGYTIAGQSAPLILTPPSGTPAIATYTLPLDPP